MATDYTRRTRTERYAYELLDLDLNRLGPVEGVTACSLEWSIYNQIRSSGTLSVVRPESFDWPRHYVRVWIVVDGDATPLGTYRANIPQESWDERRVTTQLELQDRTVELAERLVEAPYSVRVGEAYSKAITDLLEDNGFRGRYSLTPTDRALDSAMTWDPDASSEGDVSWLRVANDLALAGGYAGLYPDARGHMMVHRYVEPSKRATRLVLSDDGTEHRYVPGITRGSSLYTSFNRWVVATRADDEGEVLKAFAENDDPRHPYSTVTTGRVRTKRVGDLEPRSLKALQAEADRLKAEAMADQQTLELAARFVPLVEGDVVEIHSPVDRGIMRASVSGRSLECRPGAPIKLRLRRIQ